MKVFTNKSILGTCDIVISDCDDATSCNLSSYVLFELKKSKELCKNKRSQAMVQLLAASSLNSIPVIAVITDLVEYSEMFWFSKGHLYHVVIPPNELFGFLETYLKRTSDQILKENDYPENHSPGNGRDGDWENNKTLKNFKIMSFFDLVQGRTYDENSRGGGGGGGGGGGLVEESDVGNLADFEDVDLFELKKRRFFEQLINTPFFAYAISSGQIKCTIDENFSSTTFDMDDQVCNSPDDGIWNT